MTVGEMEVGKMYTYNGKTFMYGNDKPFPLWLVNGKRYQMVEKGIFIDGNGNERAVPMIEFI